MSRNAIAAMAVIFVSGFAGCAATARAEEASVVEATTASPSRPAPQSPLPVSLAAAALIATAIYASNATRRALRRTART